MNAKRWLKPDMTVLEIGPGDGTWTLRIAPLVRTLIVVSPAVDILRCTRERCEARGIHNIEYVLASGSDLAPLPDQSVDLFFSGHVRAQSVFEDAMPGAAEIVRVLKPGAICVSRFDLGDRPDSGPCEASDQDRDRADTLGRPCALGSEALSRIYEHVGLRVFAVQQEGTCCMVLATRTAEPIAVPR